MSVTAVRCKATTNPDGSAHVTVLARNDGDGGDVFVKPIAVIDGGEKKSNGDAMRHLEHGESDWFGKNIPVPSGSYVVSCDAGV